MGKIRFWNAEARISEKLYENNWIVMGILRVLGVFPIKVIRNQKSELFLKLSPLYALYSYALGLISTCWAFHATYLKLVVNSYGMDIGSLIDNIVTFSAVTGMCLIVFHTTLNMPKKLLKFFEYLRCIGQVDSTINMTFTKSDKYKSIAILSAPLLLDIASHVFHFCVLTLFRKGDFLQVTKTWIIYYLIYIIAIATMYINRHMAHSLGKRIKAVNKILKVQIDSEFEKMERGRGVKNVRVLKLSECFKRTTISEQATVVSFNQYKPITVNKLCKVYLKLMHAGEILNEMFGIYSSITVVTLLFHLICTKYFIILILEGKLKGEIEIFIWFWAIVNQIARLLLTIDPWYFYLAEMETMKGRVCQLLTRNVGRYHRQQVKNYSVILCLRQFKFTAWGLFDVDRTLYTTLITATTNFLVISLQAREIDIK